MNPTLSVVIPVYNQFEKLDIVVKRFSNQLTGSDYEMIIVDDGSTDSLQQYNVKALREKYGIRNLEMVRQENGGRSAARNTGIKASQGNYIIFCDGDRMPSGQFLLQYQNAVADHDVIIGGALDYFGPLSIVENASDEILNKFSRYPQYSKKVFADLFDSAGEGSSSWSWLGFLVGNSCVKKDILIEVGGFSSDFSDWGFEHFELAYRMMGVGHKLYTDMEIRSYHMVHGRPNEFYTEKITDSIHLMSNKYSLNKNALLKVFFDEKERYNFKLLLEEAQWTKITT